MHNKLKKKLKLGEAAFGAFVGLGHPDITEMLSRLGFDWLLLDAEHGPLSFETMQVMIQAMNGTDCVPIVRPQWNDPVQIKRVLDIGAYGVLVPWVNSREDAENAVSACRYPPQGIRGYGPRRAGRFDADYFKTANSEILVAIQIETRRAVENLEDILSVPGVDACYVGPHDLSCSLGLGVPPQWDNPDYLKVLSIILGAAEKHHKPVGMYTSVDTIEWALERGFRFNTVGDADGFLLRSARAALAKATSSLK
jgi:2-keto-3-deoxy-L-rhamnonate aldolase RhmA